MFYGGHSLGDLLDYENGLPPPEFFRIYQSTLKKVAESKRDAVQNFTVALGGLFDNKILKEFNAAIQKVVDKLDMLQGTPYQERKSLRKMDKTEKRATMAKTMQQLGKLDRLFSGDFDGWKPGEND